jgi:hypothetical protein
MISPLAKPISQPFHTGQTRPVPVYGITFHTTGSGLPSTALAQGKDPFEAGIAYYRGSQGPMYLIGWKGQIAAVGADESVRTWHAGVEANEKGPLQDGSWRTLVSPATVAAWNRVWGANRNPIGAQGIIPSTDPNAATIGVEMIPVTSGGQTFWAPPARPGIRFTAAQIAAARALAADVARRHRWPAGWQRTRVFGHEDLNPIRRHDAGGGWDPGFLRARPYFDMEQIRGPGAGTVALIVGAAAAAWWFLRGRRR